MRIGYPCLNRGLGCTSSRTFRLASLTPRRFEETVAANLQCLEQMVAWNGQAGLLFLRITSDLVPFASHPACPGNWAAAFARDFSAIGTAIRRLGMRISMHPDQFVLINAREARIADASVAELEYHAAVLDLLGLDDTARIQIHVGGLYGDRPAALSRFIARFQGLPGRVRARLVIENDDRLFPLADCLHLHGETGVPVLFDTFHHQILNHGEPEADALARAAATWPPAAGLPMVDYSSQDAGKRPGAHAPTLESAHFRRFLTASRSHDFDLMLEIKDKERSAVRALRLAAGDPRLVKPLRRGCAASAPAGAGGGRPAGAGNRGRTGARSGRAG